MEEQANKIVIEVCHNCKSHQWNTRHDEAKYNTFYKMMDQEIRRLCGQSCVVFKNEIPKEYLDFSCYSGLFGEDRSCDVIRMEPRLGAFQIFYKGFCLYSKLKNGVWPRIGLVARKVANVVQKINRNEDISSLLASPKSVSDMSPRSTLNRAQTASRLSKAEREQFATASRSKFVKSYAQGFYSPSGRGKNSSSKDITRSVNTIQTRKSCSTNQLRTENVLTHESEEIKSIEEKEKEKEVTQEANNPMENEELEDSINARVVQEIPQNTQQSLKPAETPKPRLSRGAGDFSINIIRSQDQELFLFGKRKESERPLPQIQHHEDQELQDHKVPSHNTTALQNDVFDEELKQEPTTPKSTYRELQNVMEEVDYQGGYLTDEGSVQSRENKGEAPQVNIYESGKQPLYYWGDSAPGGMPPTMQVVGEEEGSGSESGYSSPTPVELRVSESPDQGVLFDQIQLAAKLGPIAMQREEEEEQYGDDTFEKEAAA